MAKSAFFARPDFPVPPPEILAMLLRRAEPRDIDVILKIERLPGYDALVGRSERAEHEERLASPGYAYFVGEEPQGEVVAFALLRELANPNGNVYLQRIAVTHPGQGEGRRFLSALLDLTFAHTAAHRFYLDCFDSNVRAQRAYARLGFSRDGVLREAYLDPEGRRRTLVLMALLRPEWQGRRG